MQFLKSISPNIFCSLPVIGGACLSDRGGEGRIDPSWKAGGSQRGSRTWALDGLPPSTVANARSLASQILMDAKRGKWEIIEQTLDAAALSAEQCAVLLGAMDLANGNTALMLAAKNGHAECCRLLLERGADPRARNRHQQTAAELAAAAGHAEVIERLKAADGGSGT